MEGATLIDSKRVRCEKCKSAIQLGKDFDVSNFKKHMARCFSAAQANTAQQKWQMDLKQMLLAAAKKSREEVSQAATSTQDKSKAE